MKSNGVSLYSLGTITFGFCPPGSYLKKKKKKNFVLPCCLLRSDFLPQVHSHSDRPCCSQMELQRSLPKDNFHFKAQTWKALPCWVNEPTVFLLSQALLKGSWRKKLAEELRREEVENKTWVAFFFINFNISAKLNLIEWMNHIFLRCIEKGK